eukprot:gene16968-35192_t
MRVGGRSMGVAVPERWSWRRDTGLALLIGLAYALGSEIAAAWFEADGTNASFFPAAGVTMAAVIALEVRWWPSVMVGAGVAEVLVDLSHDLPFDSSLAYAGANLKARTRKAKAVDQAGRGAAFAQYGLAVGQVAFGAAPGANEVCVFQRGQQLHRLHGQRGDGAALRAGAVGIERHARSTTQHQIAACHLAAVDAAALDAEAPCHEARHRLGHRHQGAARGQGRHLPELAGRRRRVTGTYERDGRGGRRRVDGHGGEDGSDTGEAADVVDAAQRVVELVDHERADQAEREAG